MVDMYYLTNEHEGVYNGEEHTSRFISTRDRITMPSAVDKPGDETDGSKSMILKTDVETFKDCNAGKVKIT
jgi:hypothetical protein